MAAYFQFSIFLVVLFCSANAWETVRQVDVDKYVGRWYQVYTNFWADLFSDIEGAECTTATYTKVNATYVTVFNAYKTISGVSDNIEGYAYIPDISQPGKLLVGLNGVPNEATYWIFKLGPVVGGYYDYALVSDSRSLVLFVLARDPLKFKEIYDSEVLEYLSLNGFSGDQLGPIEVYHGTDCEYPSLE